MSKEKVALTKCLEHTKHCAMHFIYLNLIYSVTGIFAHCMNEEVRLAQVLL